MRAPHDCRYLFLKVFSTLRAWFVRFVVPGIALLAVVAILLVMSLATHAPTTHITTSAAQLIAGEGPGNGPIPTI